RWRPDARILTECLPLRLRRVRADEIPRNDRRLGESHHDVGVIATRALWFGPLELFALPACGEGQGEAVVARERPRRPSSRRDGLSLTLSASGEGNRSARLS